MRDYPSVFRALRSDAREWWYHKDLRKRGQISEARQREHDSLRSNVRSLRQAIANGSFLTIGRTGGAAYSPDANTSISGLHQGHEFAARSYLRTLRFDLAKREDAIRVAFKGPIFVPDNASDDWREPVAMAEANAFSYVRIHDGLEWLRMNGIPVDPPLVESR